MLINLEQMFFFPSFVSGFILFFIFSVFIFNVGAVFLCENALAVYTIEQKQFLR